MKAVHLVLSSGGARSFSYVGAIRALQREGIAIKSVSCCSAGTAFGALLAMGMNFEDVANYMRQKPIQEFFKQRKSWPPLGFFFRYPFAKFRETNLPKLVTQIFGKDVQLGQLSIPFATIGLDIVNDRFIVFSKETHPDMYISEAVSIATAVPGLFPPHERDQRIIVDAAVSTVSPVWLAANYKDDLPIVVLKPMSYEDFRFRKSLVGYIGELFHASASARDWYAIQSDPRVRVVEINFDNIQTEGFNLSTAQLNRMFFNGEQAIQNLLPVLWQKQVRQAPTAIPKSLTGDDLGERQATNMIRQYRSLLGKKRNQIFIGYSDADESWLVKLMLMIKPFLTQTGLSLWSNKSMRGGDHTESEIQEALDCAKVAVLLVSADFLADESKWKRELPYCIEAARKNDLKLLWVPVRTSDYTLTDLVEFDPALDPDRPLMELNDAEKEEALLDIVDQIKVALSM